MDGDGLGNLSSMCPCFAWMVPPIQDEDTKPALEWSVETVDMTFDTKHLKVSVGMLSNASGANIAPVRTIDGIKYAVIKRGLLPLVCSAQVQPQLLVQCKIVIVIQRYDI